MPEPVKSGKLAFETNGAGSGQYTGGYVDYVLAVDTNPDVNVDTFTDVLAGTFFFKPQGENSSSMLSPNRGIISKFTLWGYNYMHDSYAYDGGERGLGCILGNARWLRRKRRTPRHRCRRSSDKSDARHFALRDVRSRTHARADRVHCLGCADDGRCVS